MYIRGHKSIKGVLEVPPAEADANQIHAFTRTAPQELLQHTPRTPRGRSPTPRPEDEKTYIARAVAEALCEGVHQAGGLHTAVYLDPRGGERGLPQGGQAHPSLPGNQIREGAGDARQ